MDMITNKTTTTATNIPTSTTTKSPELEIETPTRIQQPGSGITANTKTLSFSNGVLKRHQPHHLHLHHIPSHLVGVSYKECLKNHAATLGGHALDGCGEFMPSPNANTADPSSIKCAACGCHRNFHRREPEEPPISATHVIEYQPHHRHHPPPPPFSNRSPNSASPPPISSSYYPSAPHMLLALSAGGISAQPESTAAPINVSLASPCPGSRKRYRTKFTQDQKEKMYRFAERVGWKMQKKDEDLVQDLCNEVGVDRTVLKVWMHNNKNTLGKRDLNGGRSGILEEDPNNNSNGEINGNGNGNGGDDNHNGGAEDPNQYPNESGANVGTNGSSSSS